jgi:tetratricopeptide (TPR) repeat protein
MIRPGWVRLAIALLALSLPGVSQICDSRSGSPVQMQVQLTFGEEASSGAVPGAVSTQNDSLHRGQAPGVTHTHSFTTSMQIHIQLQDPLGGTLQEVLPDDEGQARMTVCKKSIYRLRVSGPTIEESLVDDVQPARGDKLVTVVLHRRLTKEELKAQKTTVSAQRLRVPRKAQKQLDKGDAALKKGNLRVAAAHYTKAVNLYPQFEEAENNLGIVLMQEGKNAEGKNAFESAVAINPRYASAYVNLAKIAFDEKRFNDAESLARQALTTEPLNPGALFVAAESAFFKHEYRDTISFSRTLHSLPHKQYALTHFLAGKSLEAENQPAEAMTEYRTFLEEDPSDPNATRAREILTLLQASTNASAGQDANHR